MLTSVKVELVARLAEPKKKEEHFIDTTRPQPWLDYQPSVHGFTCSSRTLCHSKLYMYRFTPQRNMTTFIMNFKNIITPSTLGLLPGISVYTGTKCRAKLRYYNLARSILVLQFEVNQALHFARANLAPH